MEIRVLCLIDGPGGEFWADHADLFDAQVARYLRPFLDAAAFRPAARRFSTSAVATG